MSTRKFTSAACGLLTILVTAVSAGAAPLQMDFVNVGRAEKISIAGVRTGTFSAGELNWNWHSPTPDGWQDSFYTYCVDVLLNLTSRQTVVIDEMSDKPSPSPLVADGNLRAAWLFNEYAADIHALNPSSGGNAAAAALQVAIGKCSTTPTSVC